MFKRILIANRGEIACRIIRAAHELGIETVAIYHKVDRESLYVRMSDYAFEIFADQPKSAYLDIQQIIDVAKRSGAQAIHPGYGFLSERAPFSQACLDAGIKFIGPKPYSIDAMGSKTRARELMERAGVPIVPGTKSPITDVDEGLAAAERIGFPVLLKASAGGGGKGMRKVFRADEFKDSFESAQREALKSFGDGSIYIEKFLENPKHIEIQIIGDEFGNYVHLGERDCSIQRRHQKVIEEAPSTVLDDELRHKMGSVAIEAARAVEYVNAGTIEFLFDKNRNFYFLEMNTRLQVEHPVTEFITGIDIVKEQIRIASGYPLSFKQEDIRWRGHSIECRINAEDPFNNFMPDTGKIRYLREPGGKGVRLDSGVETDSEITIHFDPLIAKLISYGKDRTEAISVMLRALHDFKIFGVKTGIPFLIQVLQEPRFIEGSYDTGFLENEFDFSKLERRDEEVYKTISAIALHLFKTKEGKAEISFAKNHEKHKSRWKLRLQSYRKWH
ncbi:acetyl-CoA carboxylase biotin carboxylase subunit [Bacteroidetes/Chlorobi group bacterium Naka2016]|jgi:acetyl-CoA carboxylase biotin carboxylase subunit|nr:MAG: acetyl-CoA carboxylase biotin carboxylase subunit [Bacteroidetes/Chlorobi group bacterium Naka2016]